MSRLSGDEQEYVDEWESNVDNLLKAIESASRFTLGDFLVETHGEGTDGSIKTNSYGVPKKYQVVFVSKSGLPYVKAINSKGKPNGQLISILNRDYEENFYCKPFRLDPDYEDAILMGMKDSYDPVATTQHKSKIHKDIIAYNKSVKIPMWGRKDANNFFNKVNVGDIIWTSNRAYFKVVKKCLDGGLEIFKSNGKAEKLEPHHISFRNLYTQQPRTFKELKD